MRINVQSKAGRGVPKVCLDGLNIVSVLNGCDRVGMPEVVEPHMVKPDLTNDILEMFIYRHMRQVPSHLIGENEVASILPRLTSYQPGLRLSASLPSQDLYNRWGDDNLPSTSVFRWDKRIFPSDFTCFLELLIDVDGVPIKIHAVPSQTKNLSLP